MRSVTGKPSKFDAFVDKLKKESPVHISKRMDAPKWLPWVVRVAAMVVAILFCAIITAVEGGDFGGFFREIINGNFMQLRNTINLFQEMAILLIIALAVTPAFKMKFWNIGAEGQVLMGGLLCVVAIKYFGGKIPDAGVIIIALIFGIVAGAAWAVIPALFKAKWNTNETLFTLMMNYIAMGLVAMSILIWRPDGTGVLGVLKYGHFPRIGGQPYVLNIIIVAIITVIMWVYLRFSKHGYELSVVGESINTAKYIGISVPKVIIRTMLLSGALCGIAGWLLVNGTSFSITTDTVGGRGFTAVLISWLGHFDPVLMVVMSFLVAFITKGSAQVASVYKFSGHYPDIMTAVFFFIIIASEFFVNYKLKFNLSIFKKKNHDSLVVAPKEAASSEISGDAKGESVETKASDTVPEPQAHISEEIAKNGEQQNKEVTE